jgi:hypothetical protein
MMSFSYGSKSGKPNYPKSQFRLIYQIRDGCHLDDVLFPSDPELSNFNDSDNDYNDSSYNKQKHSQIHFQNIFDSALETEGANCAGNLHFNLNFNSYSYFNVNCSDFR